jgi:hypothetical protein
VPSFEYPVKIEDVSAAHSVGSADGRYGTLKVFVCEARTPPTVPAVDPGLEMVNVIGTGKVAPEVVEHVAPLPVSHACESIMTVALLSRDDEARLILSPSWVAFVPPNDKPHQSVGGLVAEYGLTKLL